MYAFRERPLTWLFLAASASIDLVAWQTGQYEADWFDAVILGQLLVLGGWAALGSSHRLARAGVPLAMILALAVPEFGRRLTTPQNMDYVLSTMFVIVGVTAADAALLQAVMRMTEQRRAEGAARRWRFSVIELLGWMVVVAVAATLIRYMDFGLYRSGGGGASMLATQTIIGAGAAVLMTWWNIPRRPGRVETGIFVAGVTAAGVFAALVLIPHTAWQLLVSYAYVGAWIVVQRLDSQIASDRSQPPSDSSAAERKTRPRDGSDEQVRWCPPD